MVSYGMEQALQKLAPVGSPYDIEPDGVMPVCRQTNSNHRSDPPDR